MFFFDPTILFIVLSLHTLILRVLPTFASPILPKDNDFASLFAYRDYNNFQISSGVGGNALEEAQAIFEDPFGDIPLVQVPYTVYERMLTMWEAVEFASLVGYPLALEAAHRDGRENDALLVGEIKNDVLMRVAQIQIFRIKIAKDGSQGKDTEDNEETLNEFEEKLMAAVFNDRQNRGRASQQPHLVYPL